MLSQLHAWILAAMDFLLGWLLRFSFDVQIFAVAIISALVMVAVRAWTSDQDSLRRCRQDKTRLKTLIRAAKKRADRDAVQRHRKTAGMIAMKQLRREAGPLLASLLPIALIGIWAVSRLDYHPLRVGERFGFTAYFPLSAVGKIAHLTPADGIKTETGWIQEITAVTDEGPAHGIAEWRLTAGAKMDGPPLRVHTGRETFEHPILIGTRTYAAPKIIHTGPLLATEVKMRPAKLFGIVPGIPAILFPPWLVAYLLIVTPGTMIAKRVLKIY